MTFVSPGEMIKEKINTELEILLARAGVVGKNLLERVRNVSWDGRKFDGESYKSLVKLRFLLELYRDLRPGEGMDTRSYLSEVERIRHEIKWSW